MSRSDGATSVPAPASPAHIRNVVLVGPGGGGKSTLFDRLTLGEAAGRRKESDQGASTGLRVATIGHGDLAITLVDTPGAPDFVGEVRAGLRAADAALFVVAAGDSVDDASRMLWRECAAVGMPRAVALTKLEQSQHEYPDVLDGIRRAFGKAQPLQVPVREGDSVTGLIDLLGRELHGLDGSVAGELSEEQAAVADDLRGTVIEAIIEESEDEGMLDRYLEGEELDADSLRGDLRAAVATARFFPIVPTHWASGVGVAELLTLFERGFPSPVDAWLPTVTTPEGEDFPALGVDVDGPLVAEVIRTTSDQYVGRLSLIRLFSGTLTPDMTVHVSGHLERVAGHEVDGHPGHDSDAERIGAITSADDEDAAPRPAAIAGELVIVTKLGVAETSDTVSSPDAPALVQPWLLPDPLLPVAIHAASKNDEDKLASALQRLVAEDVTMRLEHNVETHQLVLWALGPAHVDDLLARLRDRYHVNVEVEPLKTSLRETFVRQCDIQGRLVKQSGGHGQYAVVKLKIEPLGRGEGIEFVDKVVGGAVPRQFIPSVEKGVRAQLEKGVLAGYPVVDVRITLYDGKAHSVDSSDMAFQTAAAMALREAANEGTVNLLEPVDNIAVTVADDSLGAVMADLRGRRGQVHGTEPAATEGFTKVKAEVPQHELGRYPIDLRSVSHGTGSFTRTFVRYDYMPSARAKDVLEG